MLDSNNSPRTVSATIVPMVGVASAFPMRTALTTRTRDRAKIILRIGQPSFSCGGHHHQRYCPFQQIPFPCSSPAIGFPAPIRSTTALVKRAIFSSASLTSITLKVRKLSYEWELPYAPPEG